MDEPKTRVIQEMSVDTRLLVDRLRKCGVGDIVTDTELCDIVGRKIESEAPFSSLYSALRHVQSNDLIVFGRVRKTGYRRLSDAEIVETSQATIDSTRRASRRAYRRLTCVHDYDALPGDLKATHNANASLFSALATITKPGQVKKLEIRVAEAQAKLPLVKTLEAFSK